MKPSNKAGEPAAEMVEGRDLAKGNTAQQNALQTQCWDGAPSALDRVRQLARKDRKVRFNNLFHHLTVERLQRSFLTLRRQASAGIDAVTWEQYRAALGHHIQDLHSRLHRGAYRAKPTRRTYIPKGDGGQRALGIASLEDKIVQRAVVEILNAIYESDFVGFSYGFRPGRGPHDALDALSTGIRRRKVNWVLDADIRAYFDSIDHEWLLKFVEHRIADRRMLRLIQKWLSAGTVEDGRWTESTEGTPQGATVSPLLANIYLHYVFDLWAQHWRNRCASGDVVLVRYADDLVAGFQRWGDADRFWRDLRERFAKFALELHSEKTRLLKFGRLTALPRGKHVSGKPETFNFLGFTHISARSRVNGFLLIRRTQRKRLQAKLRDVKTELKLRRHLPIPEQGQWLRSVVAGHFAYYAVPTNFQALRCFRTQVERHWLRSLQSRGQRDRTNWKRIHRLSEQWLPKPRILHPWPEARFDVRTRGKSPVR
jgi:group II intron reverse transcriptase/maturase